MDCNVNGLGCEPLVNFRTQACMPGGCHDGSSMRQIYGDYSAYQGQRGVEYTNLPLVGTVASSSNAHVSHNLHLHGFNTYPIHSGINHPNLNLHQHFPVSTYPAPGEYILPFAQGQEFAFDDDTYIGCDGDRFRAYQGISEVITGVDAIGSRSHSIPSNVTFYGVHDQLVSDPIGGAGVRNISHTSGVCYQNSKLSCMENKVSHQCYDECSSMAESSIVKDFDNTQLHFDESSFDYLSLDFRKNVRDQNSTVLSSLDFMSLDFRKNSSVDCFDSSIFKDCACSQCLGSQSVHSLEWDCSCALCTENGEQSNGGFSGKQG